MNLSPAIAEREARAAEEAARVERIRKDAAARLLAKLLGDGVALTWTQKAPAKIASITLGKKPIDDAALLALWLDPALPLGKDLVARARAFMGKPKSAEEIRAEMRALGDDAKGRPSPFEAEEKAGMREWLDERPARIAAQGHGCPDCNPALVSPSWAAYEAERARLKLPPTCPRKAAA